MIGSTLQAVLNEKKTNVNELAKAIDVSPQTLYSIIKRDNMKIDFEILLKICEALDVPAERFYNDYLDKTKSPSSNKDDRLSEIVKILEPLSDAELLELEAYIDFLIYKRERELGLR